VIRAEDRLRNTPGPGAGRTETTLGQGGELDRALVEALAGGDPAAMGRLCDRYSSVLFALCLRVLRDRADAEEVLGDVLWELWSRPERYDARRGNLLTYLVTLARSRALDRLRSRKSRELREATAADPAVDGESPFDDALLGERRRHLQRALAALSPEQREAIEMSYYSGLSHAEISAELREPLGTIKSRIRGGLIRLRDSLRTLDEGRSPS